MAKRRENMFEALQASAKKPPRGPEGALGSTGTPRSSGPIGTGSGRSGAGRGAGRSFGPGAGGAGEGMTLPLGTVPFLFLQLGLLVLVFSIGYLVGQGEDSARAAESRGGESGAPIDLSHPAGAGSGGETAPLTPPRPGGAEPGAGVGSSGTALSRERGEGASAAGGARRASEAERAFLDPENRYTVVVFTAENSAFGKDRAWAIHDYLASKGYPVVDPRIWKGEVKIFVGAAPTTGGLADLEARLRKDPGPNGTRPFYDAYVDNADRFR